MCSLYGIELRTGCFCNQGACQNYLQISREEQLKNFQVTIFYTCTIIILSALLKNTIFFYQEELLIFKCTTLKLTKNQAICE